MNYRHIYHAGNFADVVKHAVLALILDYLKQKPAPYRVIDTHAGIGRYRLDSEEAQKTGEWKDGIGRLLAAPLPPVVAEILTPYLDIVREGESADGSLGVYPGSPLIARRLLRPGDTLVVNEAHPEDAEALAELFQKDKQTKVLTLDGWVALKSLLPPKERRGVTLIDPPFEEPGEFARMISAVKEAHERFATGTLVLWYPIKDQKAVARFHRDLAALPVPKLYVAELLIRAVRTETELHGTGLVIMNPPFTLPEKLEALMPVLVKTLARGAGASFRLAWLTGERAAASR